VLDKVVRGYWAEGGVFRSAPPATLKWRRRGFLQRRRKQKNMNSEGNEK